MSRDRKKASCIDCGGACMSIRCRPCHTLNVAQNKTFDKIEWRRKRLYGLEEGQFEMMWTSQAGLCKLCSIEMKRPALTRGQALDVVAIDHCHTTGKVRGLLCNGCNKGLGLLNDDVNLLKRAINYLGDNE